MCADRVSSRGEDQGPRALDAEKQPLRPRLRSVSVGSDAVGQPIPRRVNAEGQSPHRPQPQFHDGSDAPRQPNPSSMPHASLSETATFDASHSLSPGIVDNAVCAFDSLPVIAVSTSPHSVRDQVRQSFYSGMCWHGGLTGLYPSVAQHPNAVRAFTRLVRAVSPRHVFSSIVVLDGSEMGIRDDAQNACLPALVIPMTRFSGGQLAIASPRGQVITHGDQSFRARLCSLEQGPLPSMPQV